MDCAVHAGPTAPVDVAADRYLVLDEVKVSADGQLSTQTDNLDVMLGRQGNVLLVNGRKLPSLTVAAGSRERWRLVNSANADERGARACPRHSSPLVADDLERLAGAPGHRRHPGSKIRAQRG